MPNKCADFALQGWADRNLVHLDITHKNDSRLRELMLLGRE